MPDDITIKVFDNQETYITFHLGYRTFGRTFTVEELKYFNKMIDAVLDNFKEIE